MTFVVLMRRSFLFEKEQKDMFISLAQRKGTKETSTPSKALTDGRPLSRLEIVEASFTLFSLLHRFPYMGRMQHEKSQRPTTFLCFGKPGHGLGNRKKYRIMQRIELEGKTILVTGAAGFIGSNLVKRLFKDVKGATIIGIDNMNDYYDVALKEYRLQMLDGKSKM
jgi:hypothetical protein